MAVDIDYFHNLSSQFSREMDDLQRDISSYIPSERLDEFCKRAKFIEDDEPAAERVEPWEVEESGDEDEYAKRTKEEKISSGVSFNVDSPEQVCRLLFELLKTEDGKKIGEGRKLKFTKSGKVSTSKAQLRDLEFEHPAIGKILAYKERSKLKQTYTDGLPKKAKFHPRGSCCPICELPHSSSSWRVHGSPTTTRAETGRIQIKNPPLQTIPQKTKLGQSVRRGFVAPEGKRLVTVDWSQIELRMMAHLANCPSMITVYERDGDLHTDTAMRCFGLDSPEQVDPISHRIPSKICNFLCQYQGTGKSLYPQLLMAMLNLIQEGKMESIPTWLTVEWCDNFILNWFAARPEVRTYLELQAYRARRYGQVWDIFGRIRPIPEIRSVHSWIRAAGIRQAGNFPDQGSCAGLMRLAMGSVEEGLLQLLENGLWCWPLVTVHDQLIVETDEGDAADVTLEMMTEKFDNVMNDVDTHERLFRLPIKSDGEIIERWQKT
jgi:DNA polymerase-1